MTKRTQACTCILRFVCIECIQANFPQVASEVFRRWKPKAEIPDFSLKAGTRNSKPTPLWPLLCHHHNANLIFGLAFSNIPQRKTTSAGKWQSSKDCCLWFQLACAKLLSIRRHSAHPFDISKTKSKRWRNGWKAMSKYSRSGLRVCNVLYS